MTRRWQPSTRTLLLAAVAVFGIGTACAEGRLPTDPSRLSPSVRLSLNATVSSAGRAMKLTASYAQTAAPTVLIPFFTTTVTLTGDETELPIRIDIAGCVSDPARELPSDISAADLAQTCVLHLALALLDADGKQIDAVLLPPIAAKPGPPIESPPVVLGSVVTSVAILPHAATINALGFTSKLNATVIDNFGAVVTSAAVTWLSVDPAIATVDGTGIVTARAVGVTRIVATSREKADTATVTVRQLVKSVTLTGAPASIQQGDSALVGAVVRDSADVVIPPTATPVAYSSSDGAVLSVDANTGRVRAIAVGTASVRATAGPVTTSASIVVTPIPIAKVVVSPGAASVLVGQTFQYLAQPQDTKGASLPGRVVTWSSSDTTIATVSATGLATTRRVGAVTITATSEGVSGTGSLTVSPLPATQLALATQPGGAVTGSPLSVQPVVQVRDASAGVVVGSSAPVSVALVGTGGTLSGTTTVNAVNGVATFTNLVVSGEGSYTLTFSSGALTPVTSVAITIAPLPASQLGVGTQPGGAQAGSLLSPQPVVQVRNGAGATVAGATNAVTVTLNGAGGTLTGTTTVSAVNGVATFTDLVVSNEGSYTLTFASNGLTPVTSGSIVVTPRPVTQLAVTTQPGGVQTASALSPQPVVQVRNAIGGRVAGATTAVTATLVGTGGTLSGTTTVNAVDGAATFTNLVVTGTGTYSLAFTATAITSATSSPFGITALAASQLVVATQPVGAISGSVLATQPVVHVRDASNANVAGATNVVTAALSSGTGTLSGTTSVSAVNGVATFTDLRINGAGNSTIVFTATGLTSATSGPVVTAPLPATKLEVTTQPTSGVTGSPLSPPAVVQVEDAIGGTVSGASNAITATLIGSGGVLTGTRTVSAVDGVATFSNLVVNGAGDYAITFSSTSLTSATTSTFEVSPLPPTQLGIYSQPGGAETASPLSPQPLVMVRNAGGGIVTGVTNPVTASLVGAGGTLSGTTTVNAVSGIATFTNLAVTGAGTYTLSFTSVGLTSISSTTFTIAPKPAAQLVVATQPIGAVTNSLLSTQPVVQVRDDAGGVVTGSSASVTAALVGTGGLLLGTTTVNAVNGVATFSDLRIAGPGTYTLSFTSTSLTSAVSGTVVISTFPPATLNTVTQPVGAETGSPLSVQPVVQILNANEGLVTDATNPVTAVLNGEAILSGTTTVNAVGGVATFTDLVVTGSGAYQLIFTSGTLASQTSARFFITPRPATQLALTTQPGDAQTGFVLSVSPVVEIRDAIGAVVANSSAIVTATLNGGGGELTGNTSVAAVNGVATFSNLIISGPGTYTITFTSGVLSSASSFGVNIKPPPPATIGLNMGTAATMTGTVGATIDVPIVADMANAQGRVLGALSLNITWDPTKFDFVSVTNGSFGTSPSYTTNTNDAIYGSLGVSMYAFTGFSTGAPTIYTVTLRPKSPATTASVTSMVTAAGDDIGNAIPIGSLIVRPVAITTP